MAVKCVWKTQQLQAVGLWSGGTYLAWCAGMFKSQEMAAAGGQGGYLVAIVLPAVAIMRMDATENKADNLTWMGGKSKGRG